LWSSYARPPGSPTGTLRYRVTTNLADKDEDPVHTSRYTIHILGIRERVTSPTPSTPQRTP